MKDYNKIIYLAGPMSDNESYEYSNMNYQVFFDTAADLEELGYIVWNPASQPIKGQKIIWSKRDKSKILRIERSVRDYNDYSYTKVIQRDFEIISGCDAVYLIKGWQHSKGASCELAVSRILGLEIMFEDDSDRNKSRTRLMSSKPGFKKK